MPFLTALPAPPVVQLSRVTIEVDVVGSNPARDSFLQIDRPEVVEREMAKLDGNRRA